jgi:catechol 2,3-dioxygenase-like lactoylglutathione lyase family enzyme
MIKIRHTGLVTNDIKKSLIFWTKYLKFKIKKEWMKMVI